MVHKVLVFSRELNAINNDKHDEQKCNRIIDEGGMELVHRICDCVQNYIARQYSIGIRGQGEAQKA